MDPKTVRHFYKSVEKPYIFLMQNYFVVKQIKTQQNLLFLHPYVTKEDTKENSAK